MYFTARQIILQPYTFEALSGGIDRSPDFLVEIVETLEVHELPSDPHQLHDVVDIEALEQLIASSVGDIEVRFTVEGIQVVVIGDSVDVRFDKPADSPNQ